MPTREMEAWHDARAPVSLAGTALTPDSHPQFGGVLCFTKGQGDSYPLTGTDGTHWILKKFSARMQPSLEYVQAVATLVPPHDGFECARERCVITDDVVCGDEAIAGLRDWLEGTILMPVVRGMNWGDWISDIVAQACAPTLQDRVQTALTLVDAIGALEAAQCAHRDLSSGNVFVDGGRVRLIDWDSLYHPSRTFEPNTTLGSPGYTAPWIHDARSSWTLGADRYALAVCVAEALAARKGMTCYGEGCLLDTGGGVEPPSTRSVARVRKALRHVGEEADDLLARALASTSFADCPSPRDWTAALQRLQPRPPMALCDFVASGEPVRFGEWQLVCDSSRLLVRSRRGTVAVEFDLRSLGAFAVDHAGDRFTWFADGARSGRTRLTLLDRPRARAASVCLDEQEADLYNYRFTFQPPWMSMRNLVDDRVIELHRSGCGCRVITAEGRKISLEAAR